MLSIHTVCNYQYMHTVHSTLLCTIELMNQRFGFTVVKQIIHT